jgi:subtilisin family serine protease/uncharacterized membrane protein
MSFGAAVLGGAVGVLLLAPLAHTQNARAGAIEIIDGHEAAANEALVRFRGAARPSDRAALAAAVNADRIEGIGRAGVLRVRSRSLGAAALVAELSRRADVEFAEPNFIVRATVLPNDPRLPSLWGLTKIHAPDAWDQTVGSDAHVVAVVDTGVDYTHPDLAGNIWSAPSSFTVHIGGSPITCGAGTHGFDAIKRRCDPMDDHDHGTHVAGTIGAVGNNGVGVVGVNWTTRVMGIKFLDATGSGSIADAIDGMAFAIEARQAFAATGGADVRVLSNSWGGGGFSQAMFDEINAANDENMLFVAAAGNSSFDNDLLPTYPASYAAPNVIAVAATTETDGLAWFSNYGRTSVHLAAPGNNILSTTIGNQYESFSGTSMATPHVSGAAVLVLDRCGYDTAALKDALIGTVESVPALVGMTITGGRLDVNSAVHTCMGPPATPLNFKATAGDGKVSLTWTASLGATRYIVKRSATSGGPYAAIATNIKGAQYSDTAVVNGTTYYYIVSAANALGESAESNEASATPHAPPDLVISSFTAPSTSGAGLTVAISVTTKNQGTGFADPSITRLYLSTDTRVDAGDRRLAPEQGVPILTPGAVDATTLSVAIPSDVPVAQFYVIAKTDADESVGEIQEANNTSVRVLSIGPDLIVSALTVPSTAAAGGTAAVAWTVKNQGGGSAAQSIVRFHLSSNYLLDATDTLLAESGIAAAVGPGTTTTGSTTLTLPSSTTVGTYYVIAQADGESAVAETIETNNTTSRTVQIGGDLIVSAFTAPAVAGAGSTIVVSDTTTNQGSNTVGASITRFYLSINTVVDGNDTRLDGFHSVPELVAGTGSSGSTTLPIPATIATGTYYVLALADADGTVAETLETNNTGVPRGIKIGPDLLISLLTVPLKTGAGGSIVVSDTTKNQGGGTSAPSLTRFYLSPDTKVDATDVALGSRQIPDLGPGGSHSASTTLTIPADFATGSFNVIAAADAEQTTSETQELNNITARLVQIGPDLIVSTSTVSPYTVAAGGSVTISDTVLNQGGGSGGASTTRFYLSANTRLDATDVLLDGSRLVPGLAAGSSSTGSTTVTIPAATPPAYYYVLVIGDADNSVPEVTETNNVLIKTVQVTSAP